MPSVRMSNCPPPAATSVVVRSRRTFSSSTTQSSLMPGFRASNSRESFWRTIISALLTVAIVSRVAPEGARPPLREQPDAPAPRSVSEARKARRSSMAPPIAHDPMPESLSSERGRQEPFQVLESLQDRLGANLHQAFPVARCAMARPDETEHAHPGGPGGPDPRQAVLDHDAIPNRRAHPAGGIDEHVGLGLAVRHERRAHEVGAEALVEADRFQPQPELLRIAAGRHADGDA